ncbi:MAG: ATP-dependent DNA ligase, partial [Acidobacteria bacterium]|nr:ATP-dependent DNA ligase [Acidobacteriota bacterium]
GTVRVGLPCLDEAGELLKKAKVKSCMLGVEYYVKEGLTAAHPVQQIVSILRNPSSKKELDRVGMAVFDIAEHDGKAVTSVSDVFKLLDKWFEKGKFVHPVEYRKTDKIDGVLEAFNDWVVGEGSEGLVVRNDKVGTFKIKARHTLDCAVIGFSEGTEGRKEMLHDLLVAIVRKDGTFQELTRVGGGFTEQQRKEFLKDFKKNIVPSEYVAVNNDYVAYEMIKPGPVIEINCLDLIAERARGGPVNRMVLKWTGKKYEALSRMPLVSVISPQFVRFRDDKEASYEDSSIHQITDLAEVQNPEKPAEETNQNPSELLERVVYKKTMKENLMVRKLLLWKTNKESSIDYPGYVIYLTDFSPNRKEPLQREVKVSNDEKGARKLFDEMAKANFIGGWEKAS